MCDGTTLSNDLPAAGGIDRQPAGCRRVPQYRTYDTYIDSDGDGIPDGWLEKHYPGKQANDRNSEGYTYLELYLNSLVAHLMGVSTPIAVKRIVVDQRGGGDYRTLQEAVDAVRAFDPDFFTEIFVREGTYYEKVMIPDHVRNLRIVGENRSGPSSPSTTMPCSTTWEPSDLYPDGKRGENHPENLTIENNAPAVAQAVALHTEGDRIILRNCRLLGNQDTLIPAGRGAGSISSVAISRELPISSWSSTARFEECELHAKNSYIGCQYTSRYPYGYIFNRCQITVAEGDRSLSGASLAPACHDTLYELHASQDDPPAGMA